MSPLDGMFLIQSGPRVVFVEIILFSLFGVLELFIRLQYGKTLITVDMFGLVLHGVLLSDKNPTKIDRVLGTLFIFTSLFTIDWF